MYINTTQERKKAFHQSAIQGRKKGFKKFTRLPDMIEDASLEGGAQVEFILVVQRGKWELPDLLIELHDRRVAGGLGCQRPRCHLSHALGCKAELPDLDWNNKKENDLEKEKQKTEENTHMPRPSPSRFHTAGNYNRCTRERTRVVGRCSSSDEINGVNKYYDRT